MGMEMGVFSEFGKMGKGLVEWVVEVSEKWV